MTSSKATALIALITSTALALGAACNSQPAPTAPGKSGHTASPATGPAQSARTRAAMTAHAQQVHGTLQVRVRDQPWRVVAAGEAIDRVSAIRALGKGALVDLTDASGAGPTLWLRGGTSINLWRAEGQSRDGLLVDLTVGQARIRTHTAPAYLHGADGATDGVTDGIMDGIMDITGRDVVAYKRDKNAALALVHTERQPERAAWSAELENELGDDELGAGLGSIEVRRDANGDQTSFLELQRVSVNVAQAGDYAFTEVEHVFYNPTDTQLEGTFRFPLPTDATPLGLAMEIKGRMMEGEIVARDKARKTYESIVDEMQDPALLEWQQGNRFKLRVFPIEANSEKRVILRYAAPLAPTVDGWEYVYSTAAPSMQKNLDQFSLRFDGRTIIDRADFAAGEDITVPLAAEAVPAAVRQVIAAPAASQAENGSDTDWSKPQTEGLDPAAAARARTAGTYLAVRIRPDWDQLTGTGDTAPIADNKSAPITMLAIVDTSRSALEGRELGLQTLQMVLGQLDASDRFLVMTADISAQLVTPEPSEITDASVDTAVQAVRAIEPDGASDIGAALTRAAEVLAPYSEAGRAVEILYIGDGTPTWGTTEPGALKTRIDAALGAMPVHAAIIGKGAGHKTWRHITTGRPGRMASPRTVADARHFAFLASHSGATPRIDQVQITGVEGASVYPAGPTSLYRGDSMVAVIRSTANAESAPLSAIELTGRYAGKQFKQTVRIIAPASAPLVAQRWATMQIDHLQNEKADKETIIGLSKDFGVMSKHTSLLVLESEEAYKQHGIERLRAQEQLRLAMNSPRVTGGDLESLGERSASLSPDHIQPGDPEIRIPAPKDARSVVVIFPFGDTKLAHFDRDADAWIARFLIDKDTPDGKYMVIVNVTHADGRLQTYRLPYFVDTKAPQVTLNFRPRGKGFTVSARQTITSAEMVAMGIDEASVNGKTSAKKAKILSDARRVELYLPSGDTLSLSRKRPGQFWRRWRLAQKPTESMVVRVVVTDQAHNQSSFTVEVQPDGSHEVLPPNGEEPTQE